MGDPVVVEIADLLPPIVVDVSTMGLPGPPGPEGPAGDIPESDVDLVLLFENSLL